MLLKNNNFSVINVMTVDNIFENCSVGKFIDSIFYETIDKQKKRKNIDVENKDTILSKQKRGKR